ncbi:MAG: phosphoribosylglycinamide formyltransferase [Magnetovibrionaceae bacterium]
MSGRASKLRLGVLISGRGSNLQCLIDACADPTFPAEIALVLSNRPGALGLERASKAGIATDVIDHKAYDSREAFDAAVSARLAEAEPGLICLAGFMRLLTDGFVNQWHNKLINIHPSLLPSFKGAHAHRDALAAGVRFSGCTVHYVRPEMDAGPIIAQAVVPVLEGDGEADLAARVLEQEHRIYPLVVRLIAEGRVLIEGPKTRILDSSETAGSLINPAA